MTECRIMLSRSLTFSPPTTHANAHCWNCLKDLFPDCLTTSKDDVSPLMNDVFANILRPSFCPVPIRVRRGDKSYTAGARHSTILVCNMLTLSMSMSTGMSMSTYVVLRGGDGYGRVGGAAGDDVLETLAEMSVSGCCGRRKH